MGSRRRFRMVLDGKNPESRMPHALDRLVVQVQMRDFRPGGSEVIPVHAVVVILNRNLDLPSLEILDRVIPPMVAEF